MESNSILAELTQTVNFSGFFVKGLGHKYGNLQIELERRCHVAKCSGCGRYCGTFYDSKRRSFRDYNWGGKAVYIRVKRYRVNCPNCGIKVEKLPFALLNSPLTLRFARSLGEMAQMMTRKDVALLYGVSEDTVGRYEEELLLYQKALIGGLDDLKQLRVDEIAVRKGHNYVTVLTNHETGHVVGVVEGRSQDDLAPFFNSLGDEGCAKLKAVCMDMSRSYIAAFSQWCPNAKIIFDRFHIIKHLNDALNSVRKSILPENAAKKNKQGRHSKRALGKNKENLTEEEETCLDWISEEYPELFTVYQCKTQFQQLWNYQTKKGAEIFLTRWLKKVRGLDYQELNKFCDMVERHREGIMNYYFYPMTNGAQEGLNNKINVIRRKAYGYRNIQRFMLKIFQATCSTVCPFSS